MRNEGSLHSSRSDRGERGASLILALVFIVVVSVIVGAISSLAINDLNNTTHFNSSTALDYSASSAANLAIQSVRYAPQAVDGSPGPCWNSNISEYQPPSPATGPTVAVWCTSVHHSGSSQSRDVTMIACASSLPTTATLAASLAAEATCQSNPLLTLVEAYDDYSSSGTDNCVGAQASATTCGFGASTLVWKWGSLAAAVGGLILNTISVTPASPTNPIVGGNFTPTATATSGDPVAITPESPNCTVTGGVVFFVTAGACTLSYTDPGNFNYAQAAPYSQTFTIAP